jgi:hypothetical protein
MGKKYEIPATAIKRPTCKTIQKVLDWPTISGIRFSARSARGMVKPRAGITINADKVTFSDDLQKRLGLVCPAIA